MSGFGSVIQSGLPVVIIAASRLTTPISDVGWYRSSRVTVLGVRARLTQSYQIKQLRQVHSTSPVQVLHVPARPRPETPRARRAHPSSFSLTMVATTTSSADLGAPIPARATVRRIIKRNVPAASNMTKDNPHGTDTEASCVYAPNVNALSRARAWTSCAWVSQDWLNKEVRRVEMSDGDQGCAVLVRECAEPPPHLPVVRSQRAILMRLGSSQTYAGDRAGAKRPTA